MIKKIIMSNAGPLGIAKILQLFIPLITVPYLARIIGAEGLGKLAFSQALTTYFFLFTELGISVYSTREVAVHLSDKQYISKLMTNAFMIKCVFTIFTFLLITISILYFPFFANIKLLLAAFAPSILSNTLMPHWYFQGQQKMWRIAASNLIGALVYTVGIFVFVKTHSDTIVVVIITTVSTFFSLAYSLYLVKKDGISFLSLSLIDINFALTTLKRAFPLYLSTVLGAIYTNIYVVFLGFVASEKTVGYYSAAERIIKALLGIESVLGMSFYPHLSKIYAYNRSRFLKEIGKTSLVTLLFSIMICLTVLFSSSLIIKVIYGNDFQDSISILRILCLLLPILAINDIGGTQFFLPMEMKSKFLMATSIGLSVSALSTYYFSMLFSGNGTALAYLSAEVSISIFMVFSIYRTIKNNFASLQNDSLKTLV
ncbi:MAG: flippase [Fibrobacter sp.]|nr:flippase [Fibrobacter sp.]